MVARTAESGGAGLGKVGFPVIRFTIPWAYETSVGTLLGRASVTVWATDGFVRVGHGHSPFSVDVGWSVVFRFVEFGVLFVKCLPLVPESGFVSVKAPF